MRITSYSRCHLSYISLHSRCKQDKIEKRSPNAIVHLGHEVWDVSLSSAPSVRLITTDHTAERRDGERERPDHAMRCPQWATGNRSAATNIIKKKFTEEPPTLRDVVRLVWYWRGVGSWCLLAIWWIRKRDSLTHSGNEVFPLALTLQKKSHFTHTVYLCVSCDSQ
jgi:hypothetical protein